MKLTTYFGNYQDRSSNRGLFYTISWGSGRGATADWSGRFCSASRYILCDFRKWMLILDLDGIHFPCQQVHQKISVAILCWCLNHNGACYFYSYCQKSISNRFVMGQAILIKSGIPGEPWMNLDGNLSAIILNVLPLLIAFPNHRHVKSKLQYLSLASLDQK